MNSVVSLQTEGATYTGWKTVSVQQSLEQASNTFNLSVGENDIAALREHPIQRGARCRVLIDGKPVINGYVNRRQPSFDASSHGMNIAGRDITCDVVDSSAIIPNQELHNVTLAEGAETLCKPLGIKVYCPKPGAAFKKFVVNDGQSIFECIEAHARQRGLLVYTLGDGVLHINQPVYQDSKTTLEEGVNILAGSAEDDDTELYHTYICKSQSSTQHRAAGQAIDASIRTGRTLVIRAEKANEKTNNSARATHEMHLRQAKAQRFSLTVQGWQYQTGKLWRPGLLVNAKSPSLDMAGQYLISTVDYSVNDDGTTAQLECVHPRIYGGSYG